MQDQRVVEDVRGQESVHENVRENVQVETEPRQELEPQPVRVELPFVRLFSPD